MKDLKKSNNITVNKFNKKLSSAIPCNDIIACLFVSDEKIRKTVEKRKGRHYCCGEALLREGSST